MLSGEGVSLLLGNLDVLVIDAQLDLARLVGGNALDDFSVGRVGLRLAAVLGAYRLDDGVARADRRQ